MFLIIFAYFRRLQQQKLFILVVYVYLRSLWFSFENLSFYRESAPSYRRLRHFTCSADLLTNKWTVKSQSSESWMRIILVRLRFKYSNWLDNKNNSPSEKSWWQSTRWGRRRRRRIWFLCVHDDLFRSTMRKKSRGECRRKRKKRRKETVSGNWYLDDQ